MSIARSSSTRFRVGDWASLFYGPRKIIAQVIEDRGPIGVGRRRLYRIRPLGQDESMAFELPEEELEAAPLPSKEAILQYLRSGGLLEILRSNVTGGREQPRAWFATRPQGVVHTFAVGGATVPFFALSGDRIFTASKEEVAKFLANFGLSREEAESAIQAVGTAP